MRLFKIVLSLVFALNAYAMDKEELNKFKENNLLNSKSIHFLEGKKIDKDFVIIKGYYESNGNYSPLEIITNNKIAVINGSLYDTTTKKIISVDIDLNSLKKDAAFTIGNGSKDLFLFTEPECPYCIRFENQIPKLKSEYKLHVFLFPLESIHYLAKSMSISTLSQPISKRANYYKNIMELYQKDTNKLLEEVDKYTVDLYMKIKSAVNKIGTQSRESMLVQKYVKMIEKREGKQFNGLIEIIEYCNKKIENFKKDMTAVDVNNRVNKILINHQKIASGYVGVRGTPTLVDMKLNKINQDMIFNK